MPLWPPRPERVDRPRPDLRHLVLFAMLGTVMFVSKQIMEVAPNIHLLGMLTMVYTLVYRRQALIPIYVFVFLLGIFHGFAMWWVPHLYLWTVLWGVTMLLPRKLPVKWQVPLYMGVCALHGLCYGTLYAPYQMLLVQVNGWQWQGVLAWILAGLPWDGIHALGNLAAGTLIVPLTSLLRRLEGETLS